MTNEELQAQLDPKLYQLELSIQGLAETVWDMRETLWEHKRLSLLTGELAPLAGALQYHHRLTKGWEYLVLNGKTPEHLEQLHGEFVRMRQVVIHYESMIQHLLGINPSPGADFGPVPEDERREKLAVQMLGLCQAAYDEHYNVDGDSSGWSSVALYYQQELDRILQTPRGKVQAAALERLADRVQGQIEEEDKR